MTEKALLDLDEMVAAVKKMPPARRRDRNRPEVPAEPAGGRPHPAEPSPPEGETADGGPLAVVPAAFSATLDQPFLMWEFPHPETDVWLDSTVQPFGSLFKILVDDSHSHPLRQFVFHFLFTAPEDVVVDVSTSLLLNGNSSVSAAAGIFSGTTVNRFPDGYLDITRWSGWAAGLDQTPVTDDRYTGRFSANLHAQGGHIFGDPGTAGQTFALDQTLLGFTALGIPAGATTMFRVVLEESHAFDDDGGNLSDNVTVDFNSGSNFAMCPSLALNSHSG